MSINLYFDLLDDFLKLTDVDISLLVKLCRIAEGSDIKLTGQTRKDLLGELSMSNSHLSNSIARLKNSGLIAGAQGKYTMIPAKLQVTSPNNKHLNLNITIE